MTLEVILSILAGSVAAGLVMCFCMAPVLGVLQQCGYSERGLFRWYFHKHNMLRRRHALLALSELLLVSLFALCFSFLGSALACLVSAAPFVGLGVLYILSSRHALKVPLRRSARMMRLGGCCFVLVCALIFGVVRGGSCGKRTFPPLPLCADSSPSFALSLPCGACGAFDEALRTLS